MSPHSPKLLTLRLISKPFVNETHQIKPLRPTKSDPHRHRDLSPIKSDKTATEPPRTNKGMKEREERSERGERRDLRKKLILNE